MNQAIAIISMLFATLSASGKTIGQASAECFKIQDITVRKKCLFDKSAIDAGCRWHGDNSVSCSSTESKRLYNSGVICNHHTAFSASGEVLLEFERPKRNERCRIHDYDIESIEKNKLLGREIYVYPYFGHATFDGTKWVAAPPLIPFALRKHLSSKNIEIAEIRSRTRFLNGRFEINLSENYPHICIEQNQRSNFIFTPDPETGEFSSQPTEMQVDRVIEMFGLEKTEDFLRPDRHVVGRERIADYSVITRFNLKQPVKICGQSVPKGTQLTLSTTGPNVYGIAIDICKTAADGALFILGIPNTAKKAEKGKPPTKTLSCIPKAHKMSQFDTALELASSPSWKIKKKPVVDYDDCDCYAVEMRYPGT